MFLATGKRRIPDHIIFLSFFATILKKIFQISPQTTSSENMIGSYHFFHIYFYDKLQTISYKEDTFVNFRKSWKGVRKLMYFFKYMKRLIGVWGLYVFPQRKMK